MDIGTLRRRRLRHIFHHQRHGLLPLTVLLLAMFIQPVPTMAKDPSEGAESTQINPSDIPQRIAGGTLSKENIPNPHWRNESCRVCHQVTPGRSGAPLKNRNSQQTCLFCHQFSPSHDQIHPVNLKPSKALLANMNESFKHTLSPTDQKVSCATCHDIVIQCKFTRFSPRSLNPAFLRSGPYRQRADFCYQCHNQKAYQRLNAHEQLDNKGQINPNRCLICHQNVPKQAANGPATQVELRGGRDKAEICLNCHANTPHPGGGVGYGAGDEPDHLVLPKREHLEQMKIMTKKNKFTLPLEPESGEIYCATCHNPHERGVIKNSLSAAGSDAKLRLRHQPICSTCHLR